MNQKLEQVRATELIDELHESICHISDSIGFSLEAMAGKIPERRIDAHALTKKLLTDSVSHINRCLRALHDLDELLLERQGKTELVDTR